MNKFFLAATAAMMAVGVAMPAAASINAQQVDQRRQIDAGVRSGKITPREYRRLRSEQQMIESTKSRLKARGGYSNRDERMVHAMQDAAQAHIRMAKQNGRRAPSQRVLGAKVF